MTPRFYDVARLRAWRARIAALDAAAAPAADVIAPPGAAAAGAAAVVAGSFNPPTAAHLSLCDGALRQPGIETVWLVLAVRTVDKEAVTGACLEDRLLLLSMLAAARPNVGVALCNRGLYVEQAAALRVQIVPPARELVFVVGYDKIEQIFDGRYYTAREASLARLFGLARFLVAARDGHGRHALAALLAQSENRLYQHRVAALTTLPADHDPTLSSTQVRAAYAQDAARETTDGQGATAAAASWGAPDVVWAFARETGVYAPPLALPGGETVDRYGMRLRLLEALAAEPASDFAAAEFAAAVRLATADSAAGRALRRLLAGNAVTLAAIRARVQA